MKGNTNKRAIQLSVNFLVMLILGLFVLGMGLILTYKILNKTDDMTQILDSQLKDQVLDSLNSGSKVSIVLNPITTKSGKVAKFPLGIYNIERKKKFYIRISYKGYYDYNGNKEYYTPKYLKFIFNNQIGGRDQGIDIAISIDEDSKFASAIPILIKGKPGKYVFKLEVFDSSNENKDHLYDNQIHYLYVILE